VVEIEPHSPQQISIRESLWQQMVAHVETCLPEEACGLLAGKATNVQAVIPVENTLHSSVKYRMHPIDQLRAFRSIDHQGLELIAIYHSHPHGPDRPSVTDVTEAYYPKTAYIILYTTQPGWNARAFLIDNLQVNEITLIRTGDL
jgi:proteasome lid subunit RPN8/RPN11